MSSFRYAVEIFAPPRLVWDLVIDVERWPEWTPTVTRVERLEPGPLVLGSRARLWQPKLLTAVWKVSELDEDTGTFTWFTARPGIRVTAIHRVEPTHDGATRLTLELKYGSILGPFMAMQLKNLNWDYLTKEAQGLKTRCERW